jgi:hypothetical protein
MYIDSDTAHAQLCRGRILPDLAVATVVVGRLYDIVAQNAQAISAECPASAPTTKPFPLWEHTSVTAAGKVHGPARPPYRREVVLTAGSLRSSLVVQGERRWRSDSSGRLAPTVPLQFDEIPLQYEHAFGGVIEVAPGPDPVSGLPHPGGRAPHALNPRGRGFYGSEADAKGNLLASIEFGDSPQRCWPPSCIPAGLAPCADLSGLRLADGDHASEEAPCVADRAIRMQHHAHGRHIVAAVRSGAEISVAGLGERALSFSVPQPPSRVSARRANTITSLDALVRSVHIDASSGTAYLEFSYSVHYRPSAPPTRIMVLTEDGVR